MCNIKISLCMIVKNEQENIKKCLDSVQDLVDEIIIVDTGSSDRTMEICKQYNHAQVYDYEWNNHFAEARNFSLSFATSDWILWLDADEQLDESNRVQLRETLESTNKDIIYLPIYNYVGETFNPENVFIIYQPRFIRNHEGINFYNRIHETLHHPQQKFTKHIQHYVLPIHHYGYLAKEQEQKHKSERNFKLLNMEKENDDPWVLYHLASEHYRNQDYITSFHHINKSILAFILKNHKPPSIVYRLKYAILIETRSFEGAEKSIDKAIELYPDYVDLHFCKGYILYELKDYQAALDTFKKCMDIGEEHPAYMIYKGVGSYRALEYKKKCLEKLGKT